MQEQQEKESEWGAEGAEPVKKRRVPTWVWWGCGGGCLLMLLVAIGLTIFVGKVVSDATDPEKVWAQVAEILPHDQRPQGWEAIGTTVIGVGQFALDPPEEDAFLFVQRFPGAKELDAMFDPESPQNRGIALFGALEDAQAGTFELQGREVRCLRFRGGVPGGASEEQRSARGLRLDLSAGDRNALVQISLVGADEVGQERVEALLAPFDLWRGR